MKIVNLTSKDGQVKVEMIVTEKQVGKLKRYSKSGEFEVIVVSDAAKTTTGLGYAAVRNFFATIGFNTRPGQ